jgi:hypothetical protein
LGKSGVEARVGRYVERAQEERPSLDGRKSYEAVPLVTGREKDRLRRLYQEQSAARREALGQARVEEREAYGRSREENRWKAEFGERLKMLGRHTKAIQRPHQEGGQGRERKCPGGPGRGEEGAPLGAAAKKALADVAMMEDALMKVAVRNREALSMRLDVTVDSKGTIVNRFPDFGAAIRYTESNLYFTPNDEKCMEMVKRYVELR